MLIRKYEKKTKYHMSYNTQNDYVKKSNFLRKMLLINLEIQKIPKDVIYYILEFAPEHRVNFKQSLDIISCKACVKRMKYVHLMWQDLCENYRRPPDISYLYINVIDDPEFLIQNLSNCKCCDRHMKNRPDNLFESLNLTSHTLSCKNDCNCICRSSARWLCRTFS